VGRDAHDHLKRDKMAETAKCNRGHIWPKQHLMVTRDRTSIRNKAG